MANSRYIAYLDDDNYWLREHLSSLLDAIQDRQWAFSLRWFTDPETDEPFCLDHWESTGPGLGIYNKTFGGFVDPNCLMLDKLACEAVLHWWSVPALNTSVGMDADRNVFAFLNQNFETRGTEKATVVYRLNERDKMHPERLKWMAKPNLVKPKLPLR